MRRISMFCVITLCLPLIAAAQDHPKTELFAGFSILAADGDDYQAFYGLQSNVAFNFHENVGIVMDFGFQTKTLREPLALTHSNSVTVYEYLFGPRFSKRWDRATVFTHALFGGISAHSDYETDTGVAMGFGGGVDINAGDSFAIRAVQFDWTPNRIGGSWSTSEIRLGFGVVFKFGI